MRYKTETISITVQVENVISVSVKASHIKRTHIRMLYTYQVGRSYR